MKTINQTIPKPFLRWAGGKTWLIKHMPNFFPNLQFNNYHEPFLGGAAMFFHLQPKNSYLSDINSELIETYEVLKNDVNSVISELSKFHNTEEFYYMIRQKRFNKSAKRAAKFIYLNQTSFNGIYRVNLNGKYNVPFGYRKKDFLDEKTLVQASESLSNSKLSCTSFIDTIDQIKENDLVFIDPPYTVTHNLNGFIKYNSKLFNIDAQYELSNYIDEVKRKGAHYILTNAAHKVIEGIFSKEGDYKKRISRASLIGGVNAKRGQYKELIFTNIPFNE